jgi:hypothetical protein
MTAYAFWIIGLIFYSELLFALGGGGDAFEYNRGHYLKENNTSRKFDPITIIKIFERFLIKWEKVLQSKVPILLAKTNFINIHGRK